MLIVVSMLGIEDVTLDANKRITSTSAANGRININLVLIEPNAKRSPTWLDLGRDTSVVISDAPGSDQGQFACACVGDIDGDGEQEIVCGVTRSDGTYLLSFKRNRSGIWKKSVICSAVTGMDFIRSISLGDVNGDGCDEILLASRPNGRVVMFAKGDHGYVETVIEENTYGIGTTNAREVLVTPTVLDGRSNILVTTARTDAEKWGSTPGTVLLFTENEGQWSREILEDFGGLTHSRMIRVGQVGVNAGTAVVINEVGIYDKERRVIEPPTRMAFFRGTEDGWKKEHIADIEDAVKSRGFALGDVDNDGRNELVLGTRAVELSDPSYLYVFKQNADGSWIREMIERSGALGYHHVEAADIDGDGVAEILASDDSKGLLKSYKRRADGSWMITELLSLDYALFCVSMHALDGDARKARDGSEEVASTGVAEAC